MTTQITINPLIEERNLSPYQQVQPKAPDIVNDDFLSSFADLFDIINPLQHIPVVSTIYRQFTGDAIGTGARIAGGALFGGPIGLFAAVANEIIEGVAGQNIGASLFAAATGKYEKASELKT